MASNGVAEEGVEEMETEMSPEANGTCLARFFSFLICQLPVVAMASFPVLV